MYYALHFLQVILELLELIYFLRILIHFDVLLELGESQLFIFLDIRNLFFVVFLTEFSEYFSNNHEGYSFGVLIISNDESC